MSIAARVAAIKSVTPSSTSRRRPEGGVDGGEGGIDGGEGDMGGGVDGGGDANGGVEGGVVPVVVLTGVYPIS